MHHIQYEPSYVAAHNSTDSSKNRETRLKTCQINIFLRFLFYLSFSSNFSSCIITVVVVVVCLFLLYILVMAPHMSFDLMGSMGWVAI